LAFLLPLVLILFFGYAITYDINDIQLGVLDHDDTQQSQELVEAFQSSGYFSVVARVPRYRDVDRLLGEGSLNLVLVIPPAFSRDLEAGRRATVQLLLDGADANTATVAQNYAEAIASRYTAMHIGSVRGAVTAETRVWYNESLESRNMIVPGLVAVIMSIIAAMLTSLTMAREWERGTMEQLAATPVSRLEVVLGKLTPYMAIGLVDVAVALAAGALVFGVPFRGNVLLLGALTVLFLLGTLGFGLFISAAVKSQVLATQVAMTTTYLPALLLSGFLFSIPTMPLVLRLITYVVPARYYIVVTRGVLLKDVGVGTLWIQGVAMIVFALVGLTLALRAFRKEIA
jgi:ABC-2 type transport system permease protein